jgi:hypothetical protein
MPAQQLSSYKSRILNQVWEKQLKAGCVSKFGLKWGRRVAAWIKNSHCQIMARNSLGLSRNLSAIGILRLS